jgi:hypothetical protein
VKVSATDNVGNSATKTNTFQLHATSLSLLHNMQRACGERRLAADADADHASGHVHVAQNDPRPGDREARRR